MFYADKDVSGLLGQVHVLFEEVVEGWVFGFCDAVLLVLGF
jgi:hypothetical protein